jgi:8-oxo-dGTP pyrophosphatase MutT (NUDIX family)
MTAPPRHPVDVFLLLLDGESVLLALRQNTGYADGQWNLPSGKLEIGEDAVSGMIREADEEIGIRLDPGELRLAATVHHRAAPDHTRLGLVFAATSAPGRQGEPLNAEPHKCGGIQWFPADALPPAMSAYSADCIRAFLDGVPFLLSGWPPPA